MNQTTELSLGWRLSGWGTLAVCALMLTLAGVLAAGSYDVMNDPQHEPDALDGLGYFLGILVAAPAVLSLVLSGSGMLFSRASTATAKVLLVLGALPVGAVVAFAALLTLPAIGQ